jgi:hypothetical protein
MNRVCRNLIVATFFSIVMIPLPARADTLLVPWLGANTGNHNVSGVIDVGASVGTMVGGVIGVDVDFGYSPDFFGNNLNSYVLTTMGNVTVGLPFDRGHAAGIRPYLTGGVGLIRARIDSPRFGLSVANNDVGVNVGGGVMAFLGGHFGVRADLRYLRSLEDNNSTNPFNQFDLDRLHYWRTSFGVVLR